MPELHAAFSRSNYLMRRKVFKLLGGAFHIYGEDETTVCFYAEQKAFKLKEEFTVFGDEAMAQPLLRILARQIIDISAVYDITDAVSGQKVGAVRRKGLASLLRDEWEVLGIDDKVVAIAMEDSLALALIRRLLSHLVPQSYDIKTADGNVLGRFKQRFNPFIFKMDLEFLADKGAAALDRRLGIGLATCMMAIEGRQN